MKIVEKAKEYVDEHRDTFIAIHGAAVFLGAVAWAAVVGYSFGKLVVN